jgi:hypothetical protein
MCRRARRTETSAREPTSMNLTPTAPLEEPGMRGHPFIRTDAASRTHISNSTQRRPESRSAAADTTDTCGANRDRTNSALVPPAGLEPAPPGLGARLTRRSGLSVVISYSICIVSEVTCGLGWRQLIPRSIPRNSTPRTSYHRPRKESLPVSRSKSRWWTVRKTAFVVRLSHVRLRVEAGGEDVLTSPARSASAAACTRVDTPSLRRMLLT